MTRYLGGLITKDESLVLPSNNYEDTSAPGVWTLEEAQALNKQGLWPTAGVDNPAKFIENIFSVDTYTGNGSARTITTGIDLVNNSGLVWIKNRTSAESNFLCDTVRGAPNHLNSDSNAAQGSFNNSFGAFASTGFTLAGAADVVNSSGNNKDYVAWTFRKKEKFFDLVTWTGDGTTNRSISHSLGQIPGMIIAKKRSGTGDWHVLHRSVTMSGTGNSSTGGLKLNATGASTYYTHQWEHAYPEATLFKVAHVSGASAQTLNTDGETYIAYLFGHDTSSDGMIQCGSYTGNGSTTGPIVNLGFEPQWIMYRKVDDTGSWHIHDVIRGIPTGSNDGLLYANRNYAENYTNDWLEVNSTGFQIKNTGSDANTNNSTYIYIAIRRGPMATPTTRASVFAIDTKGSSGDGKAPAFRLGNIVDMQINRKHATGTDEPNNFDLSSRLLGTKYLVTNSTAAEANNGDLVWAYNNGVDSRTSSDSTDYSWLWRRAPKFFDIVTYGGNNTSGRTITHNLGVVPEMIWIKNRGYSAGEDWAIYHKGLNGGTDPEDYYLRINANSSESNNDGNFNDTAPTSTVFTVGSDRRVNANVADGNTYVAYLFATLAGISKVGSFSHTNGSSTDVDCGFSSGSSFVIAKRRDASGDWYVWDSSRGIVSGNDPYLALNSTDNPVTDTDYIDTLNSGFQMSSSFTTGDYIFYAIAA